MRLVLGRPFTILPLSELTIRRRRLRRLQGYLASPDLSATPPYSSFLMRTADCSLTRVVLDSNHNVVEEDPNYQDSLQQALHIPTIADQFPVGCNDPTTGIAMEQGAVAGKF